MYLLNHKTILLISPQSWGKMFVSKHHYAAELVNKGNKVFFLNPPAANKKKGDPQISIVTSLHHPGLFIIDHWLSFPYNIKFHFISLFHFLMHKHVKRILKKIGSPDIVWSFDLGNLYPLSFFHEATLKIFHPVDEPLNTTAIDSAKGSQIIFSVTEEILDKYAAYNVPKYFVNHGVSPEFLNFSIKVKKDHKIRVGFAGNLLRHDIDRKIFLQIINENPDVIFECWGAHKLADANLSGSADVETHAFIAALLQSTNVLLHGAVTPAVLAAEIQYMDAFLICYDVQKDQSKGTNYHKVMEFISTGKIVIANNITTYKNRPDLVQMVPEREHNNMLPGLFKKIINSLAHFNTHTAQVNRKTFAGENTYNKQLMRIEELLQPLYQNFDFKN